MATELQDAPIDARSAEGPPALVHLQDPKRLRRSLCGRTLKPMPGAATHCCVVCCEIAQYGQFATR